MQRDRALKNTTRAARQTAVHQSGDQKKIRNVTAAVKRGMNSKAPEPDDFQPIFGPKEPIEDADRDILADEGCDFYF